MSNLVELRAGPHLGAQPLSRREEGILGRNLLVRMEQSLVLLQSSQFTVQMFPLDQRNDCQVRVLAPHFPLCQQTNVPVRCWDTKTEHSDKYYDISLQKYRFLAITTWSVINPISQFFLPEHTANTP